jgi:hypothetical protein
LIVRKKRSDFTTMKFLLENDLHGLKNKTVRLANKKVVLVAAAFPNAYGDLRLLRFYEKTKQDQSRHQFDSELPFTGGKSNVDEIRTQVETNLFVHQLASSQTA